MRTHRLRTFWVSSVVFLDEFITVEVRHWFPSGFPRFSRGIRPFPFDEVFKLTVNPVPIEDFFHRPVLFGVIGVYFEFRVGFGAALCGFE